MDKSGVDKTEHRSGGYSIVLSTGQSRGAAARVCGMPFPDETRIIPFQAWAWALSVLRGGECQSGGRIKNCEGQVT